MTCPVCGGKSKVTDTCKDCDCTARRLVCIDCNHIFYTTEVEEKDSEGLFKALARERREKNA